MLFFRLASIHDLSVEQERTKEDMRSWQVIWSKFLKKEWASRVHAMCTLMFKLSWSLFLLAIYLLVACSSILLFFFRTRGDLCLRH